MFRVLHYFEDSLLLELPTALIPLSGVPQLASSVSLQLIGKLQGALGYRKQKLNPILEKVTHNDLASVRRSGPQPIFPEMSWDTWSHMQST